MKDSFIFYDSFLNALDELEPEIELQIYRAITHYALKNEEPQLEGVAKAVFCLIKPQIDANNKRYEDGKKGGRPKNENKKTTGYENKKPVVLENAENKKPNVNVNDNVNDNVNENENFNVVEETTTPAENLLLNWYGEYQNVHLTEEQYNLLKCNVVGNKETLDGLIDELSSNIAQKNPKAPPYDEQYPDMHFSKIKAYWNYRKLHGFKPPDSKEDKAQKIKDELDKLTEQYRAKDLNSG